MNFQYTFIQFILIRVNNVFKFNKSLSSKFTIEKGIQKLKSEQTPSINNKQLPNKINVTIVIQINTINSN